jgi:hypothetical protein
VLLQPGNDPFARISAYQQHPIDVHARKAILKRTELFVSLAHHASCFRNHFGIGTILTLQGQRTAKKRRQTGTNHAHQYQRTSKVRRHCRRQRKRGDIARGSLQRDQNSSFVLHA